MGLVVKFCHFAEGVKSIYLFVFFLQGSQAYTLPLILVFCASLFHLISMCAITKKPLMLKIFQLGTTLIQIIVNVFLIILIIKVHQKI